MKSVGLLHNTFFGRIAGAARLDPPVHASVGDDTLPILGFMTVMDGAPGNRVSGAGLSGGVVLSGGGVGVL